MRRRLSVLPALALLFCALVADAGAATCRVTASGSFPALGQLRSTNTGCATANAVAQGIIDGYAASAEDNPNRPHFPARVRTRSNPRAETGRLLTWRCRYRLKPASYDENGDWLPPYQTATCTRLRSVVRMGLFS